MNKKPSYDSRQLAFLGACVAIISPFSYCAILKTPPSNRDIWIVMIISIILSFFLSLPLLYFTNKFKGYRVTEINDILAGKVGGGTISFLFALFSFFAFTVSIYRSTLFINTSILQATPFWVTLIIILIPTFYAVYKGSGTICRLASFVFPIIMFSLIFFFFIGIKGMHLNMFKPVLSDSSFSDMVIGISINTLRFFEIIVIYVFAANLKMESKYKHAYWLTMVLVIVSSLLIIIPILITCGAKVASLSINPYFLYTWQVGGYGFLNRIQAFNTLAWVLGAIIEVVAYLYVTSVFCRGAFRKGSYRSYIMPITIIAYIICVIPSFTKVYITDLLLLVKVYPYIAGCVFALPIIMLIIYLLRRKKIDEKLQQYVTNNA